MQTTQLDERSFVDYATNFLSEEFSDELLNHLLSDINWRVTTLTRKSGAQYTLPRLQCWMSDEGVVAQLFQKEPAMKWSPLVLNLKHTLETLLDFKFDYVLLNLYRDGQDRITFHRDNEAEEEGKNVVASVSVGASRDFLIKHLTAKNEEAMCFKLNHGSLIVMRGDTQLNWMHSVPEAPDVTTPRVNLTFRKS